MKTAETVEKIDLLRVLYITGLYYYNWLSFKDKMNHQPLHNSALFHYLILACRRLKKSQH